MAQDEEIRNTSPAEQLKRAVEMIKIVYKKKLENYFDRRVITFKETPEYLKNLK